VDQTVSLKFLVEGEHGSLSRGVDVASTTATTEEELGSGRWNCGGGGWSSAGCELEGRDSTVVTGTTTAAVVDIGGVDWSVSDLDGHCDVVWELRCGDEDICGRCGRARN